MEEISEIEERLKYLMTKNSKKILNLYLLKLIYLYQKKNFQIYRDYEEINEREQAKAVPNKKKMILQTVKTVQKHKEII